MNCDICGEPVSFGSERGARGSTHATVTRKEDAVTRSATFKREITTKAK